MKLKTLVIAVLVLAALSVAVHFLTRPAPPNSTDPRVGTALLDRGPATTATQLTISANGATVTLRRDANNKWKVSSYHDIPADFAKLSRFISDLTTTKIDRFVTANPERLSRLDFSDTTITLADDGGKSLWSMTLGKTADNGGRFLRFPDADRAYLARLNLSIDPTAKNWADSTLIEVKPADIAKVELTFPDGAALVATRANAEAPYTADSAPDGQQLKSSAVASLVTSLTGLRFIDTAPFDVTDAVDARAHARTATLTTFDGQATTITLGRRPEVVTPTKPDASTDEKAEPKTTPAGPVFAEVKTSKADAWINSLADKLALKISDYSFTNLPQTLDELFEPQPPPSEAPKPPTPASP